MSTLFSKFTQKSEWVVFLAIFTKWVSERSSKSVKEWKKSVFEFLVKFLVKIMGFWKKSVIISKSLKNSTMNFQSTEIIKMEVRSRNSKVRNFSIFSKILTKLIKISKNFLLKSSKIGIWVKTLFRHSFYLKKGKRVSERSLKSVKEWKKSERSSGMPGCQDKFLLEITQNC